MYRRPDSEDLPNGFYHKDEHGIIEYSIADELREELMLCLAHDPDTVFNGYLYIPSPSVLYALKMTHRFKKNSPHFHKTRADIRFFRKNGVELPTQKIYGDLFKRIEKHTLNYSKPSLDQKSKDFFRESDQKIYGHDYNHDSIHEAVKLFDKPAYYNYMKDGQEVMCDKLKWDACPEHIKIAGVYEECAVLSLERSLIVNDFKDPEKVFTTALEKVCTSITSGWFREYAWENIDVVWTLASKLGFDRMEKCFKEGLVNGVILENSREAREHIILDECSKEMAQVA
jgi:hypothetical protein